MRQHGEIPAQVLPMPPMTEFPSCLCLCLGSPSLQEDKFGLRGPSQSATGHQSHALTFQKCCGMVLNEIITKVEYINYN